MAVNKADYDDIREYLLAKKQEEAISNPNQPVVQGQTPVNPASQAVPPAANTSSTAYPVAYLGNNEALRAIANQMQGVGKADPTMLRQYAQAYLNNAQKPFEYNYGSDPMYAQLREAAIRNGQIAMKDTIGKSTALTGGYMNSYAQSAGQQAYNQYMDALNDKIPELEQRAYDRYQQNLKQDLQNLDIAQLLYNTDQGIADKEYARLGDEYDRLLKMAQYDTELANDANRAAWERQANMEDYRTKADIEYEQWKKEQDYGVGIYQKKSDIDIAEQKALNALKGNTSSGSTGSTGSSSGSTGNNNPTSNENLLGTTDSPADYQKGTSKYNTAVKVAINEANKGHYDTAGETMANYILNGQIEPRDGIAEYANKLIDDIKSGDLKKEKAVEYLMDFFDQLPATDGVITMYKQLKKTLEETESDYLVFDDIKTVGNAGGQQLYNAYKEAVRRTNYKGTFTDFLTDVQAGVVRIGKDWTVR